MQDKLGTIEVGKYADIVAVPGDPLADVSVMEKVDFVMKGALSIEALTTEDAEESGTALLFDQRIDAWRRSRCVAGKPFREAFVKFKRWFSRVLIGRTPGLGIVRSLPSAEALV